MTKISSIGGFSADNSAIADNEPVLAGAKAVESSTYAPAYTANDAVMAAADKDNGGLLVNQTDLDQTLDKVTAYLAAGTDLVGIVGIDQTISGVTNGVAIVVPTSATDTWSEAHTTAYATSKIAKASSGILRRITGYNSGGAQFIQVHNTTTLPADSTVPIVIIPAAAASAFNYDAPENGMWFSTGITVCNSSTGPTKTIGSADCWFNIFYK